jgi:hypothetical protein
MYPDPQQYFVVRMLREALNLQIQILGATHLKGLDLAFEDMHGQFQA